jgi:hypothetical protein
MAVQARASTAFFLMFGERHFSRALLKGLGSSFLSTPKKRLTEDLHKVISSVSIAPTTKAEQAFHAKK